MSELRRAAAELISSLDSVGGLESDEEGAPYEELKKRMDRMHDAVQSLRAILSTGDAEPVAISAPDDEVGPFYSADDLIASLKTPDAETLRLSHLRYEYIRTLNVTQFKELYEANIRGDGTFDELVDRGRKQHDPL